MPNFSSLGISNYLVEQLNHNNITVPTLIQKEVIPHLLNGQDVIGQAQTGTGKTLAFILPILEKIDPNANHIQALIVTPTRELAIQITKEVEKLIKDIEGLDVLTVYGGQDVEKQLKKLKKNVQIVVATPGRLLDHLRRETIDLKEVSYLVLDEADQMLHIGFLREVELIIHKTSPSRQMMLFSATMSSDVKSLAKNHMHNPKFISVEKKQGPAETVDQLAVFTTDRAKQPTIISLIEKHQPYLAVIFCRTKRRVNKLNGVLKSHGFLSDELHSDISQSKRERVMKQFRDAKLQLLVATDVAARGLDVEGVTHVYNYDIPEDTDSYIHRIGRTGRAGSEGLAVTFYSSDDRSTLEAFEKELNIVIEKQKSEFVKEVIETDSQSDPSKQQKNDIEYHEHKEKKSNKFNVHLGNQKSKRRIKDKDPREKSNSLAKMEFGNSYTPTKSSRPNTHSSNFKTTKSSSKSGSRSRGKK